MMIRWNHTVLLEYTINSNNISLRSIWSKQKRLLLKVIWLPAF